MVKVGHRRFGYQLRLGNRTATGRTILQRLANRLVQFNRFCCLYESIGLSGTGALTTHADYDLVRGMVVSL